eukprot:1104898-Amphidinium_carterae.1
MATASSADFVCKGMLKRIGWDISVDKATPFAEEMSALGVNFLFGDAVKGVIFVKNKESRVEE